MLPDTNPTNAPKKVIALLESNGSFFTPQVVAHHSGGLPPG
jgi:hypothetical protein